MKRKQLFNMATFVACALFGSQAIAQTGVDDDRVSLPEGPGSLEGVGDNVEIDPNMGSMRYNINVKLPQGRQGMTPDLNLNYSSSAPAGLLGIGWSMSTPTIERMTSRRVPLYDTTDFMAADGGTELVLVDDSGANLVYRERFEKSFKRYTWISHNGGSKGYWKVEEPNGIVCYYGATSDGTLVNDALTLTPEGNHAKYHLVEKVDPFGNKVRYTYDKFGKDTPHISQVQWVFGLDGSALYTANLSYEMRPDPISDANHGFDEVMAYRLNGIEIFADNELMRQYELVYEAAASSGGFSRLTKVTEYGLGGKAGGIKNPIEFAFEYQKALGAECSGDNCDKPYMVEIPNNTGASLGSGKATLVDINGDALPDILDTNDPSAHKFYLNTLTSDGNGNYTQSFAAGYASTVAVNGAMQLGQKVQTLDVNGDGFSDLVDLDSGSFMLKAMDKNDWASGAGSLNVTDLRNFAAQDRRFLDYDNDKRIDVIVATSSGTQILENNGNGFVSKNVDHIGVGFATANLQMADMNGDGMSDPVRITSSGAVEYKLNLGRGKWSTNWITLSGATLGASEVSIAELEDLNGDGRDDLVVVSTNAVKYALNRGDRFDAFINITSSDIQGDIPQKTNATVLYADMNANGSEDVVWFKDGEPVRFLELFPQRPNLMSRVDNNIGFVQKITYTTAAQQAADAAQSGKPWTKMLQMAMPVVAKNDSFVTLTGNEDGTGLHDITLYSYQDAFYDGIEKQFRGFETVTMTMPEAQSQQQGTTVNVYDLGDQDVYLNGLLMQSQVSTDGKPVRKTSNTYIECPLDEVPSPSTLEALGRFPVKYICQSATEVVHQEQAPEADWLTTRMTYEYDGYGNIIKDTNEGIVGKDGDELTTETAFAKPTVIWHLNLPIKREVYDDPNGDRKETTFFYDGDDFVGSTEVTHGFLSRQVTKVDNNGKTITSLRQKRDQYGNAIETIDPNGSVENQNTHRRSYTYDQWGLFLSQTDLHLEDSEGAYLLRRESRYDAKWQQPIQLSDWVLVRDGEAKTPGNPRNVIYDELGRQKATLEFGDEEATPSMQMTYSLGSPVSSVIVQMRSTLNGAPDMSKMRCFDGKGRLVQTRTKIGANRWLVTGFTALNSRGAEVEVYQPFESTSDQCDMSAPSESRASKMTYDALFRKITTVMPDASIYGSASTERIEYGPLKESFFDVEDMDESSPHHNTPLIRIFDGLNRPIEAQRTLVAGGEMASYKMTYDNTNSFTGYIDPAGNAHLMSVDLADRVVSVTNPNFGTVKMDHDDVGNVIRREDGRGVVTLTEYDGQNRLLAKWQDGDREKTLVQWAYDTVGSCPKTECTYLASRVRSVSYPFEVADGQVLRAERRMGYDTRQRPVFHGVSFGGFDLIGRFAYDNQNRPVEETLPTGELIKSQYDGLNRVIKVDGVLDSVGYAANGQLQSIGFANGAKSDITFDEMLRPKTLINADATGAALESYLYSRDRMGNLTVIEDKSGREDVANATQALGYDAWYRLTNAQMAQGKTGEEALSFQYNALDNITSLTSSLGAASAAHVGALNYDANKPNAVSKAGAVEYTYDEAGHMITRGNAKLNWDYQGRLVQYEVNGQLDRNIYQEGEVQLANLSNDGVVLYKSANFEVRDGVSYTYVKLNGQRVARIIDTSLMASLYSDVVEDGVINAADAWALGQHSDTKTTSDFNAALSVEQTLGASAARLLADEEDNTTFLQSDHLGSVTIATNEGGEVRGQRHFYPTGMVHWQTGSVDHYGFTGQEHLDSGMVRFQFRYLDPIIGRWASFDPLFVVMSADKMGKWGESTTGYAYVANNFLNMIDPLGLNGSEPKGGSKKKKKKKKKKKQTSQNDQSNAPTGDANSPKAYGYSGVTLDSPPTDISKYVSKKKDAQPSRDSLSSVQLQPKYQEVTNDIPPTSLSAMGIGTGANNNTASEPSTSSSASADQINAQPVDLGAGRLFSPQAAPMSATETVQPQGAARGAKPYKARIEPQQ